MNKKLKVLLIILAVSFTSLYAADSRMGTESDPLVTKSYVDAQIAKVNSGGTVSSAVEERLALQEALITVLSEEITNLKEANSSAYEIVTVVAGQTIYGKQGSEMIIRSGEGEIVASSTGGVQDITDGIDLSGGVKAPRNNLLLIPREDGRGITATKDMVVMVRGGYTIL